MSIINDRRIGIFRMSLPLVNDAPAAARAVMAQVIVLRAELKVESDDIEYVAISDGFAEVPLGNKLRTYSASIRQLDDGSMEFAGWSSL